MSGLALRVLKKRYIVEVHFHVTKDNHIFCTAYENYGDVFRSKNALYSIDLNDMSAKKIFSVRNAYSKIFVMLNWRYAPLILIRLMAYIINDARFVYGYTYVIIKMHNQSERNSLKVYDIQGARMLDIPYTDGWSPEIVISTDKLYYTTKKEVVCYNINTSTTSVVYTSDHDKYMSLSCDGTNLFIIENMADQNGRVTVMKLLDNQCISSTIIPEAYFHGGIDNIIVNGIILSGNDSLDGLHAYDFIAEKGYYIPFRK